MTRLDQSILPGLPTGVERPTYDRDKVGVGIVHLGIGAFHRAHQAVYTDDVLSAEGGDWAICGVSLRHRTVQAQLDPQDGLYCVVARDGTGDRYRIVGAVKERLFAPADPAALVARMADPRVRIVSLTVTEKGYCHDPASGRLQTDNPGVLQDLKTPAMPTTAVGFLAAALEARRRAGVPPFTVLTCDNLPHNGRMLAGIVKEYAHLHDRDLADWIAGEVAFPCSMVDRIVPATTDDDRAAVAETLGVRDEAAVICEPFSQWVIEDSFTSGRPDWEAAGAEMVPDVAPFEDMKLRLLNGAHSMLAYLGYLAGYETISETMANPAFARLARHYMDREATPTLAMPPGVDLTDYKDRLIARFRNPALKHRTWQIAMDGSQKLPQRLLSVARARLQQGASIDALALAVAAWIRYAGGTDEKGQHIDVRDPLAARLRKLAQEAGGDPKGTVEAFLAVREVFDEDLPQSATFRHSIAAALAGLISEGARRSVECFAEA